MWIEGSRGTAQEIMCKTEKPEGDTFPFHRRKEEMPYRPDN